MTHEHKHGDEAAGPEHTHDLPDAADMPVHDRPEDSFAARREDYRAPAWAPGAGHADAGC